MILKQRKCPDISANISGHKKCGKTLTYTIIFYHISVDYSISIRKISDGEAAFAVRQKY